MDDGLKIIVMVKQVPNTSEVKIDPKTGSLIREGIESIMNPEDRHGLELALNLKAGFGGRVTALDHGAAPVGGRADRGPGHGRGRRGSAFGPFFFAGADTWATAYTLGLCLEKLKPFDLIIAGRQAIDGDTAQIGPQVAEGLGLPQVTYVPVPGPGGRPFDSRTGSG